MNEKPIELTLEPQTPVQDMAQVEAAAQAAQAVQQKPLEAPRLDDSQLTPAERQSIDDFIGKLDITNPDHVLLFGAEAQKKISDFSDKALDCVRTADTGEVGDMLVNHTFLPYLSVWDCIPGRFQRYASAAPGRGGLHCGFAQPCPETPDACVPAPAFHSPLFDMRTYIGVPFFFRRPRSASAGVYGIYCSRSNHFHPDIHPL